MSRIPVQVRDAVPEDAAALVTLWSDTRRTPCGEPPDVETARAVARIGADPDERLLVAVIGGTVVGGVHLRRAPSSPVNVDDSVHVSHLNVLPDFRRHGVGHALMEAAVAWAEDKDVPQVLAVSSSSSRDANRFMARLGLGQIAVLRGASTVLLRTKLPADGGVRRPVTARSKQLGHVVAMRRSMRRRQSRAD